MPILRHIFFIFFCIAMTNESSARNGLAGEWINIDPNTKSITKIIIKGLNGRLMAHTFGKCSPGDCDWGIAPVTKRRGSFIASYQQNFAIKKLIITPSSMRTLRVRLSVKYKDQRPARITKLRFKKIPGTILRCPDLIVTRIYRPIWHHSSSSSQVKVTIKNIGHRRAGQSFTRLTDLNSGNWDVVRFPSISPGSTTTRTFTIASPWIYNPNASLKAEADYKNDIKECKEKNNHRAFRDLG